MEFKALTRLALAGVMAATLTACSEARPAGRDHALREGFVEQVKRVGPAVVHIKVQKGVRVSAPSENFWSPFGPFPHRSTPRYRQESGLGTGVIVSPDGYIVTNHHVVGEVASIQVRLVDGRELTAKLVGTDEPTDLAVIKIDGTEFPYATLGDSDTVEVGQWALAIGNPFGLDSTVTLGIISARGRRNITGLGGYEDFIQTDAAVNPGNSGGPLINMDGEVIGINSAIFSRSGGYDGIAFAIPSNLVKTIRDRLLSQGRVVRAWLGVGIQDISNEIAAAMGLKGSDGAIVTSIMPGTPAAQAGMQVRDVITELDGKPVKNSGDLRNRIAHTPVGSVATLGVVRGGRPVTLRATLGTLPTDPAAERERMPDAPMANPNEGKLGIFLQELTREAARQLGVEGGLLVTQVRAGGLAEAAGLQAGEIIVEVNRQPMRTLREFAEVVADLREGEYLLLLVTGREGTRLVAIKTR